MRKKTDERLAALELAVAGLNSVFKGIDERLSRLETGGEKTTSPVALAVPQWKQEDFVSEEPEEPGAPKLQKIDASQIWEAPAGIVPLSEVEKFVGLIGDLDELVRELAECYLKDYRNRLRKHREAAGGPPATLDEYYERLSDYRKGLSELESRLCRVGEYVKISGQGERLNEIKLFDELKVGDVVDDLTLCGNKLKELLETNPFQQFETGPTQKWIEKSPIELLSLKEFIPDPIRPTAAGTFDLSAVLTSYVDRVNHLMRLEGDKIRRRIAASPTNVDTVALEKTLNEWQKKLFQALGWVYRAIGQVKAAPLDDTLAQMRDMALKQVLSDWRMLCRKIEESLIGYMQDQGLDANYNQKGEVAFSLSTSQKSTGQRGKILPKPTACPQSSGGFTRGPGYGGHVRGDVKGEHPHSCNCPDCRMADVG